MKDPLVQDKKTLLNSAKKSIYNWKNNPENNEKSIR